ncbi:MAG: hypothetical protein ABW199_10425 [Caulobacterales bacterium]
MAKKRKTAVKPQRRSRDEIDRNYFFGDIFIKMGVGVALALGMIGLFTPFTLMDKIRDGAFDYVAVIVTFGAIGVASFVLGRHLRKEATHWDFD